MNPYIADDELEIDLLDLGKYLLRRIVWIVLAGIIIAGLFCAFKYRGMKAAVSDQGALAEAETEYERELEKYELESELIATSDKNTTDLIRTQEEYLRTSPLMQMDPYHVWRARTMVRLESKGRELTPFYFENLYRMELSQSEAVEELADRMGTDRAYVGELFSVDSMGVQQMYLENTSADSGEGSSSHKGGDEASEDNGSGDDAGEEASADNGIGDDAVEEVSADRGSENDTDVRSFYITALGSTRKDAQRLMDLLLEEIDKVHDRYADEYPHELKIYKTECVETVDTGIRARQKETLTHTQSLLYQMRDNVDKGTALLTKPAETAQASGGVSRRDLVKFGVIGFVIGILLMCVIFAVRYITNKKLVDYMDAVRKGFVLKDLGSITDQGVAMAAANIRNFAKDRKRLFLTGMTKDPEFENVCGSLKEYLSEFEIVYSRDVVHDPKSREVLLNCDAAVLVEQKGITCYPEMKDEVTFVVNAGKDIVGIVIV